MRSLLRVLAVVAFLACGVVMPDAHAQSAGSVSSSSQGGGPYGEENGRWYTSKAAAEGAVESLPIFNNCSNCINYHFEDAGPCGGPPHAATCEFENYCWNASGSPTEGCQLEVAYGTCVDGYSMDTGLGACVANTPHCGFQAGASNPVVAAPADVQGQEACMADCEVQYTAGFSIHNGNPDASGSFGNWVVEGGGTSGAGADCKTGSPAQTDSPAPKDPHGNTCEGDTCGKFAPNSICDAEGECVPLSSVGPNGGCVTTPGGHAFCTSSAPTPPAPDDGSAGQKATPDGSLDGTGSMCQDGETSCSFSAYNSSTTSNSSTNQGSSGASGGGASGGTGGGVGGGASGGSGNASSGASGGGGGTSGTSGSSGSSGSSGTSGTGGDCVTSASSASSGGCSSQGGNFSGQGFGSVKTFSQALDDYNTAIAAAPVIAAAKGVADAIPSGGTPPSFSWTTDYFGGSQTFTFMIPQDWLDTINSILPKVMLLVWALISIFIFLKA